VQRAGVFAVLLSMIGAGACVVACGESASSREAPASDADADAGGPSTPDSGKKGVWIRVLDPLTGTEGVDDLSVYFNDASGALLRLRRAGRLRRVPQGPNLL
jgi:hypothetical protein